MGHGANHGQYLRRPSLIAPGYAPAFGTLYEPGS